MPRKKFLEDLGHAKVDPPAYINTIRLYDSDNISFNYFFFEGSLRREIRLNLITTSIDNYPHSNGFILFTDESEVPLAIQDSLEQLQASIDGMSVLPALKVISSVLSQTVTAGQHNNPISVDGYEPLEPQLTADKDDTSDNFTDAFDFDEFDCDSDDEFGLEYQGVSRVSRPRKVASIHNTDPSDLRDFRTDLRMAKAAGFKIGAHGNLQHGGIACVSIKVAKLGISEEAMQAWSLSKHDYLVLLIRYQQGYCGLYQVVEARSTKGKVEMRVGLCNKYKPYVDDCFDAFTLDKSAEPGTKSLPVNLIEDEYPGKLKPIFIGRPLNDLLSERFAYIVKFRGFGLSWDGAEAWYNDTQGILREGLQEDFGVYADLVDNHDDRALPPIVTADCLASIPIRNASLPLVAMQFVLRHLVRCTEFCLVCHCKVKDSFEALKPYVCSKPLCLYQFLALGFGPSIEWEIISQPYVVDLLISLCYSQARAGKLKELPHGIGLKVPLLPQYTSGSTLTPTPGHDDHRPVSDVTEPAPRPSTSFDGTLFHKTNILVPNTEAWTRGLHLRGGEWLALLLDKVDGVQHYRVRNVLHPNIFLCNRIVTKTVAGINITETTESSSVRCYLYDQDFDTMSASQKHMAITAMLDVLPSVATIQKLLTQQQAGHRDPSLTMLPRIAGPARDLLRWIVASNRSCIMQVDTVSKGESDDQQQPSEPRVSGMDDWMQFRFAQGAPDKEQRFVDCVRTQSANSKHPTLFAWHGSPLHNWHSIIRTGLNFDNVAHGRANGHGVYMSSQLQTSIRYTGSHTHYAGLNSNLHWPSSELKVTMVISLQEVVNAPANFVCLRPHFVVAQKDWIQTRYLFVKAAIKHSRGNDPESIYDQDPAYPLIGSTHSQIKIPVNAVSKSRGFIAVDSPTSGKKRKLISSLPEEDVDAMSQDTSEEDNRILESDFSDEDDSLEFPDETLKEVKNRRCSTPPSSETGRKRKPDKPRYLLDSSRTSFVPNTLDVSNIKFLPPPLYATSRATTSLMKAFRETTKTQESTPLHDLGFYIDPDRVENLYQWIVELHSFDAAIPLARDMTAAGITSIVLEMRFSSDFPYSPPFVRVVKPRFLPFSRGGGGHVTEGGAICMELLTSSGWSVVSSIESVLLQVKIAISDTETPARLMLSREGSSNRCYEIGEAVMAFKRACKAHGWKEPEGVNQLLQQT